jgi:hypothetical protein
MEDSNYSPYCSDCEACGEEGCCSALCCKHTKTGHYCKGYLVDLRFGYAMYRDIQKLLPKDEKTQKEFDRIWEENYNIFYRAERGSEDKNSNLSQNLQLNIDGVSGSADRYTTKLDKDWDDDIYTIEEWNKTVEDGWICNDDGSGYWVKDGLKSRDEVFSTPQLDATHVVWYNK